MRGLAACAALVLLGAGCGGGSGVDHQASDQLATAVAGVRAAANAHDATLASSRLDDVRRMVLFLRVRGDLSDRAAGRILVDADAVGTSLGLIPTTTTTTTMTTTTTTTLPPPPAPSLGDHGHGNGNGNGSGNGND
jgi:hypothetical protein